MNGDILKLNEILLGYSSVGVITDFMTAMKHVIIADICIFSILVILPYEAPQFRVQGQLENT